MNKKFNGQSLIGDVVATFPGASNYFLTKGVDFCCGGNRPLSTALVEKNLEEELVLTELNQLYQEFLDRNEAYTDWVRETPSKLAQYILDTHHQYLHTELPVLEELIATIREVHGDNHPELARVQELYLGLKKELEEHLEKEETRLFPLIFDLEPGDTPEKRQALRQVIEELEAEHVGAGDLIKELREIANHYLVPEDACRTFMVTYDKLRDFEKDLFSHIHLENNILFKNL